MWEDERLKQGQGHGRGQGSESKKEGASPSSVGLAQESCLSVWSSLYHCLLVCGHFGLRLQCLHLVISVKMMAHIYAFALDFARG